MSHGCSQRRACSLVRQHRSTQRKPGRRDPRLEVRQRLREIAAIQRARRHGLIDAAPGLGPSQNSPDFTPAVRQAAELLAIDTVWGDAGWDAEHSHRLCREHLGVRQTLIRLNRRNTGRRWPKTPCRRARRHRFPKPLDHQRRHVESGVSQHKRRLGSALTTRNRASQNRELVRRVLTHNLTLLAESTGGSQQSNTGSYAAPTPGTGLRSFPSCPTRDAPASCKP